MNSFKHKQHLYSKGLTQSKGNFKWVHFERFYYLTLRIKPEIELLNIKLSLFRLEFLSGFLTSFFCSTKCYGPSFLFRGFFCWCFKTRVEYGLLWNSPVEEAVNSKEHKTRVFVKSKNSISRLRIPWMWEGSWLVYSISGTFLISRPIGT